MTNLDAQQPAGLSLAKPGVGSKNAPVNRTSSISGRAIAALLDRAETEIDGREAWDIQVRDGRLFQRVLRNGRSVSARPIMDGWWDCDQLDALFARTLRRA
jgi:hypothetical protein